ncbi:MAG TPA: hypothetical protein VFQ44_22005 [Streptosporangiaceae bacterium]|nr:hypothetical protein [Streptosporangiaceae bacterium]
MIYGDAALGQQFLNVAVGQAVTQVPADRDRDHLPREATVDRLLHHAHLVLTKGDSHRLAEALTGKGVIPLAT